MGEGEGEGELELEISTTTTRRRRFIIGYALAPKKVDSAIQAPLVDHAKSQGIDLIPIDPSKSLIEQQQPPHSLFDCIIHKLYDQHWKQQLSDFSAKYPNVNIIDPPDAIERLHNRVSMLQVVDDLNTNSSSSLSHTPNGIISFGIPKQVVVYDRQTLIQHGLNFPVIAKPFVANGKDESHNMCLVYDKGGLSGLQPPIVLQEFVNHGGVIFKVYVAGKHVQCVTRRSLPDISQEDHKLLIRGSVLPFSQISNLTANNNNNNNNNIDDDSQLLIEKALMPPSSFVDDLANGLRKALNLNLFNFDMIRDSLDENRYLIIDINYFPGYAKIPAYVTMLTDFFLDVVVHKQEKQSEA